MTIDQIKANLEDFLDFMKENGYPVFHKSNIFMRDFQYAVRDYFRKTTNKDIGTRKADEYAQEIVQYMEQKGLMKKLTRKTWILQMEKYLNSPEEEEQKEETAAAS